MIRSCRTLALFVAPMTLAACAGVNYHPQTKQQFVSDMKEGGVFRNKGQFVVKRSLKAAVADAREYADKCLNVGVSRKLQNEAPSSTQYHPTLATEAGVTTLVVQETYNGRPSRGAPEGGLFSFVAELRPAGANSTQVDTYYITGRGKIGDYLQPWLEGQKQRCPGFS